MLDKLKNMQDHPKDIHVLGSLLPEDTKNIVAIGTRNITNYGKYAIKYFIPGLVKMGFTICSTLTNGSDLFILETALKCNGRCIVYLSYGLDLLKNDENYIFIKKLLDCSTGAVISPFSKTEKMTKESTAYRNAVMTFLSSGVLVTEAGRKSGTSSCIKYALEYGKNVYCVPGDIFRYKCMGTNNFIKEGAFLVNTIEDFT